MSALCKAPSFVHSEITPPPCVLAMRFRINKADTSSWYSYRRVGDKYSGHKVLIEDHTNRIIGIWAVINNST